MISVDGSLFIQIINFIFLIWVLNVVLYRPIRNVLVKRKEKIEGFEKRIDLSNKDAQEKEEAYVSGIREARSKGLKEKEALLASAAEEEKKIIDKINKKSQADLAKIREKISEEVEEVRASLQKEIDSFASAIGQKILGRAV